MSERQLQLAERRQALRAQSEIQREHLGRTMQDIETRLGGIDRGIGIARHLIKTPIVLAGGIALVAFIGPRRLLRLAGRSAVLFTSGRRIMRLFGRR